ncbi:hypothetical protein ZWY2020_007281 [Hordeum vulgare]|nr:hypothetical protein ZWY2020_007281 [Hordeum vulgare]
MVLWNDGDTSEDSALNLCSSCEIIIKRVVDSVEENNLKDNTNLQQKYDILNNLTAAQAKVIRNFKNNHLNDKERLTEERHKLQNHIF